MSAYTLFKEAGVTARLYKSFLEPMLLVTLFAPPTELSAAAALGGPRGARATLRRRRRRCYVWAMQMVAAWQAWALRQSMLWQAPRHPRASSTNTPALECRH